jgi:aspartyl/asparaginyl-tRNA synthetase
VPDRFAVFDVRATVEAAAQELLAEEGFVGIRTPKITGGGSESGASVFELPYFGDTACLVQSVQFYAQMAIGGGFDRVYEIGPVFRAENSLSNRHATEFTVLHVELAWPDSHETLMAIEEELVRQMLERVAERHGEQIVEHFGMPVRGFAEPIPRIPLREALALLGEAASDPDADQLTARDERALGKLVHQQHGHDFVFVTDFPQSARPFYTMAEGEGDGDGSALTRSFDLLWRGVEITSGAQREHRHDRLRAQAEEQLGAAALEGYLDPYFLEMFRYGCPPHGGFGLGIDRFVMILLGEASLGETSLFFRGPERFMP